jgi:hypothetical protein
MLILVKLTTSLFFNTKILNVLIEEVIDVLSGINRGLIYMSVVYAVLDIGLLTFNAFFTLLKTIGINAIYNTLKLTAYFLSVLDVIAWVVCYRRFNIVIKECSYYFNYYQYHQNQPVSIISYFMNKEKFIYCENRHSELYYCIVFTAFVVCLYIPLGLLKIIKLFL